MSDDSKTLTIGTNIGASERAGSEHGEMGPMPSPMKVLDAATGYQRTAAIKAAIELELFGLVGEGADTFVALAARTGASERGLRILCDYLVSSGFLTKVGNRYQLTVESRVFLDRKSPAYIGEFMMRVLLSPVLVGHMNDLAAAVRKGGTADEGIVAPEHPVWADFARAATPMTALPAEAVARLVGADGGDTWTVLDVAAGHGLFGLAIARHNPNAKVIAVDWPSVLAVAEENARTAGVGNRFHALPGSAFEVDYGMDNDVVLLTNFLHHFSPAVIEEQLAKVYGSLKTGGRVVLVEFIRNEDGVSPSMPVEFALQMLASTEGGDAYTFSQFQGMLERAGFVETERHDLLPTPSTAVIARKRA